MSTPHPFYDPATHGFVRVAAATPGVAVGDPECNAGFHLDLARRAHDEGVDLIVFPELGLSSYAIDDLHLQHGMLGAVDRALHRMVEASADLQPVLLVGLPLARNGRLYNCAAVVATAMSAREFASAPSAMATAISSLTAPHRSMSACARPRSSHLAGSL